MPSPFPGMDPYLEGALWPDVHASLIPTIRAALVPGLPEGYVARIDQYVWLGDADDEDATRLGKPDAFVSVTPKPAGPSRRGNAATVEPTVRTQLPAPKRVRRKRYIRLTDLEDRSVFGDVGNFSHAAFGEEGVNEGFRLSSVEALIEQFRLARASGFEG